MLSNFFGEKGWILSKKWHKLRIFAVFLGIGVSATLAEYSAEYSVFGRTLIILVSFYREPITFTLKDIFIFTTLNPRPSSAKYVYVVWQM